MIDKHIKRLGVVDEMLGGIIGRSESSMHPMPRSEVRDARHVLALTAAQIRADWERIAAAEQAAIEILDEFRSGRVCTTGGAYPLLDFEQDKITRVIKLLEGIPAEEADNDEASEG